MTSALTLEEIIAEIWLPVPDFDGYYEISNFGNIRGITRTVSRGNKHGSYTYVAKGMCLKQKLDKNGYLYVSLSKNNKKKNFYAHLTVLRAFFGPAPQGMQGCHSDGNKTNNHLGNLRYDTCMGNHADKIKHGTSGRGEKSTKAKLTSQEVSQIRSLNGVSQNQVAAAYGVSQQHIGKIVRGLAWTHEARASA